MCLALGLTVQGCASQGSVPPPVAAPAMNDLTGTTWQLVEFQSSDDRIGTVRPDNPQNYTLMFDASGRVAMRLNCNRGSGAWAATPSGPGGGSLTFGQLAVTRAFCPPPSLDGQLARDMEYVRSYVERSGRLYLNLMADGGTYVWEHVRQ